jgi:hypothetical protein
LQPASRWKPTAAVNPTGSEDGDTKAAAAESESILSTYGQDTLTN